ncbi:sialidase family protein [Streptomyces chiangmaiensis]|uniref:Sialidase family protein n=1 Tax=Streptomyces chiangmaiensis TaxID=766497 RepID=A0ABU7FT77_9ACTN|nr:sialidase family protein [Streptomyces chiangmaiensis]MED7826284.1 sialidase family protein [Streptomyces chiangmaiensis]
MHLKTMKRTLLVLGLSTALAGAAALPATAGTDTPNTATATQWQPMGPNASGGHLAFTPAMPSRVYVLPDRGMRIDRSDDHGLTWQPQAKFAIPNGVGMRLAADPHDPDVVYVAGRVGGGGQGFLLRSDDGARTFRTMVDSPTEMSDVVVSPSGQYVYAAGEAGVFVSSDHGLHWQQIPGSPSGATRLVLDGNDLFVGTGKGIHLIEDALGNAGPAQKLPTPLDLSVENLSARGPALVASNIFQGAVFSTDHGRTWTQLSGPWGGKDAITYTGLTATGELQAQTVGAAAGGKKATKNLWVSRDLGQTWTPKPAATKALDVYTDTGSFPDRPQEQVIAAPAGIYTTSDSVRFQRIGAPDAEVDSLTVSGSALIAGTATAGSYRSTAPLTANLQPGYQDWGWTGQSPFTIGNQIEALATVPGEKATVLRTRGGLCMTDCFALERSADGGATWRTLAQVPGGASFSVAVDPRDTSKIYAASTFPAVGVYASQDGGSTFQLHQFPGLQNVSSVAVDPRDGSLWIGDVTGLYHSTDSGATGVKVLDGEIYRIAIDPTDPNHIVAVGNNVIKVSHDGGASFSDATGIPELTYDDVTFAPDGTLFAASRDLYGPGQGVFRSDDGGMHWSNSVSAQLLDPDVHSVLVSPDGHWLFAGTGSGVYRLALS